MSRRAFDRLATGALAVFFLAFLLWWRILYLIPAGSSAVLFSPFFGGTDLRHVLSEGLHFVSPLKQVTIYDERMQSRRISTTVLQSNGMELSVDVVVYFHPVRAMLPYLHQKVGADYADQLVVPMASAAILRVIGDYNFSTMRDSSTANLEEQ